MSRSKSLLLIITFFFALQVYAQIEDSSKNITPPEVQNEDSSKNITLPTVIINAFEQNRRLKDVPAAINYIGKQTLEAFGSSSIVSAVNTTPGVRMEERSPGSYRMNIRGSSLRSPFGVRNIKIYYNGIPFTDPGGQSYLNQLGYYNFNSIEIIKGSNNSLYGAGTGGAMLIESINENEKAGVTAEYGIGSYNLQNFYAGVSTASDKLVSRLSYQHQQCDGYRDHSSLKKNIYSWNGLLSVGKDRLLETTFLFGDLFYQTPGALTKAEYEANPKAARSGNAVLPGAVQANAFVRQQMFLAGASYTQQIANKLQNKTTLYGMYTNFQNPNINNFDKSAEPHAGGRTIFKYEEPFNNGNLSIDGGAEFQKGFTQVTIYKNVSGSPDTLRSSDNINNSQSMLFLQASLYVKNWTLIAGASWNTLQVRFQRFMPNPLPKQKRTFNNQTAPRLSLMRKVKQVNFYTSIAKGFSSPSTDELLPTGGVINFGLNAEEGTNYDIGLKGNFLKNLYVDIDAFFYSLKNAIVQRRDISGGNYFVNAGSTRQHGIETFINYPLSLPESHFKKSLLWLSYTWHNFHYKNFKQLNNDFSGNQLPSVPRNTISSGFDVMLNNGLSGNINYYYSDKVPLNDANTEFAKPYHLIGAKLGFEKGIKNKIAFKISGGIDNLLNQHYSLGNDINGFGGRYYNAAPGRNFYISLATTFITKNNLPRSYTN